MNKSNFSVTSSYLTNPTTTRIDVQSKDGSTWLTRDVPGDHTSKTDEAKVQLILDILATELDPEGALARYQAKSEESIKDLDSSLNLAEKVAEQLGELTRKIANVSILNAVMSQNIQYGTIYKRYLELLPVAKKGDVFNAGDIFAIEATDHEEVDGEGKLVLIQVNGSFTYENQPFADFAKGGKLENNGIATAWLFRPKEG